MEGHRDILTYATTQFVRFPVIQHEVGVWKKGRMPEWDSVVPEPLSKDDVSLAKSPVLCSVSSMLAVQAKEERM